MKKIFKKIIVLVIIAAIILSAVALVARKKNRLSKAPKFGMRPYPVRVATSRSGTLSKTIDYVGVVEPFQVANISSRLTAEVNEVLCDEGSLVKEGDILLRLDDRDIKADIASVSADIARVESELAANKVKVSSLEKTAAYWQREADRDKVLADKGDIPIASAEATIDKASEFKGEYEAAKHNSSALISMKAALESKKKMIETTLSYSVIRSPYDGVVTKRFVDPGDLASTAKNLLVVEDSSKLKISFDIPQRDITFVKKGAVIEFTFDGKTHKATVTNIYPTLDKARMMHVEAMLSKEDANKLKIGQYVSVALKVSEFEKAVLVASESLVHGPDNTMYVFVVKDNNFLEAKKVKVLGSSNDETAVEGVSPNEQVVVSTFLGWANLSSGIKVEVLR